jgi:predicted esterase/ketosteroid isomerase-like protein
MDGNLALELEAVPFLSKTATVRVVKDVKFGSAGVGFTRPEGAARHRDLTLDIYQPEGTSRTPRPALIMAFGGAFHRGSKENDVVEEGVHRNTPVSEYCREFARRGYVCFSIDYRLMQEAPDPGVTPTMEPGAPVNVDRVNYVRNLLGFAPCTQQMMIDEIEAATDDMSRAVAFVRSRSAAFGIDPARIAIGGFSAGAIMAINAALAERVPAAAVLALSGRMSMAAAETYVTGAEPPLLMIVGENDLPGIRDNIDGPVRHMTSMGATCQLITVPGATHFYPRTASVVTPDGARSDVESVAADFLHRHLRLAELSEPGLNEARRQCLVALFAAFNRHDVDSVMACLTSDIVFDAATGPEAFGRRFRGTQEVRAAFAQVWRDIPDIGWTCRRHTVAGDTALSEWLFSGTRADGSRLEVEGCDIFEFEAARIKRKSAFRKDRTSN